MSTVSGSFRLRALGGTALVCAAAVLAPVAATAQEAAAEASQGGLSEIVVTAQKRSENLLDVPSSVSVVGSEQLERFNATQLSDFAG